MTKYLIVFTFVFLNNTDSVWAQTVKDSLWSQLTKTKQDTSKLKVLKALYNYYKYDAPQSRNIDSAEFYINAAYKLAMAMKVENSDVWDVLQANAIFYFQEKKDPISSVRYYLQATTIAENMRDTTRIGFGYLSIGNIYTYQHLTEKALENFLKSYHYYEKAKKTASMSIASNVLGYTYRSLSKMDSAEYYFQKAITLSLQTPDKFRLQSYLYNIIDFYKSQNNTAQMRYYLQMAFKYKDHPTEMLSGIAKQLNIGKYYQMQKQYNQAISYLMEVVNIKQKNKSVAEDELLVEAYRSLSQCYLEMNDYKNAYFYLEKQKNFGDSLNKIIYSRDTAMTIIEMQAAFNVERAQTALKNQRNYNLGLGILTLLIIGFAILMYRNNRIKELNNIQLKTQGQLLEQQKKELSELNATKDKLLSLIAHDIRAPLSSLTTLLTLWQSKTISGEKFEEISGKVRSNLHYLRISLDNLLVWSSTQLQGINPRPVNTWIQEVINNELHLLNETAEQKHIKIINQTPSEPLLAFVDAVQLSVIVRNILSNAIKFTHPNGHIVINVISEEKLHKIIITDNGMGMPQKLVEKLFQHNEIDNIRRGTANEKGTGLGLNVAKEFVESNGGTITVESHENQGTKVFFTVKKA
ncbi:MAG: tetratricopeptide repeat-containing sensor histidine kinase [Saprospiraceae bacterium]|nr:tetratricopeptide repeat-containing sensor histidine kinase [Saprospiraceae bacterium]